MEQSGCAWAPPLSTTVADALPYRRGSISSPPKSHARHGILRLFPDLSVSRLRRYGRPETLSCVADAPVPDGLESGYRTRWNDGRRRILNSARNSPRSTVKGDFEYNALGLWKLLKNKVRFILTSCRCASLVIAEPCEVACTSSENAAVSCHCEPCESSVRFIRERRASLVIVDFVETVRVIRQRRRPLIANLVEVACASSENAAVLVIVDFVKPCASSENAAVSCHCRPCENKADNP